MRSVSIFIVLAAAISAAWLTTLLDNGLGMDWAYTAVRNWEQYGLSTLHGKIVINPGGFQADTHPDIYPGHRAASLYPAFWLHHLCVAIGLGGLGFVAYYAVISGIVLVSIWWLLGRTERAFWLAAIAVVTPGFVRWQITLDPNLAAVLFGFPFCAAVIALLRRPSLPWPQVMALFAVILVYSTLNWTTVFVHAMLFITLLALTGVPRRHIVIYAGLTAAMAGWVLVASVASKMNGSSSSGAGMASMLQSYGWGNAGYGLDMATTTALARLLAANFLGLLPLLLYMGWLWWERRDFPKTAASLCLLPLLVMASEILGMRNYFGHHPWMSIHFVLLAIILAMVIWKDPAGTETAAGQPRLPAGLAWLAGTFAYSFFVLFATQVHNGRQSIFATFVIKETSRDTSLVISRGTDPVLAEIADRLATLVDRHIAVEPGPGQPAPAGLPAKSVMLTTVHPDSGKVLAQTALEESTSSALGSMLRWYSEHIAKRRASDKLEIPGQTVYLYRPVH